MNAGATPVDWCHWDLLLSLTADLLPVVCEPGLTIAPTSKLVEYGKVPSRFDQAGRVVGFPKWTSHVSTSAEVDLWGRDPRLGICLQTRFVRAIDVDVSDADLAGRIAAMLPGLPIRRRANSPKFLALFAIEGDWPKQTLATPGGMIEFLGTGQQCLVAGTHPSGTRYAWEGGLPAAIPGLTPGALAELMTRLRDAFGTADWSLPRIGRVRDTDAIDAASLSDPVATYLRTHGWVIRDGTTLDIRCPWQHEHSAGVDPSATSWFLAGTSGFELGHFRCLHGHCAQRTDGDFLDAIGYQDEFALDGFEAVIHDPEVLSYEDDGVTPAKTQSPLTAPEFIRDQKGGTIKPLLSNFVLAFGDPEYCGATLSYDAFKDVLLINGRPFKDADYTELTLRLMKKRFGPGNLPAELIRQAVGYVAEQHAFDSAIAWLQGLPPWDGVRRIESFCSRYLGVPETPYSRAVGRYWWTAHAGRVLSPGCQADIAVILISGQGTGKTSSIKAMVPEPDQYVELSLTDRDEDLSRAMRGKLIGEMAELRGLNSRDLESIKAWISRTREEWVPKYLEFSRTFPRRLVLVGTSNQEEFLADETGNRRFAPLLVGARQDREGIARDRGQLWAEARDRFLAEGVLWHDAEAQAKSEHARFEIHDAWVETVRDWLGAQGLLEEAPGTCDFLRLDEVLRGALGIDMRHVKPAEQMRAGKVLHVLGYKRGVRRVKGIPKKVWISPFAKNNEDEHDLL